MPRSYKPIQQHEKEILKMREEGKTNRQIGEKLGFSKEQIKQFINRYNKKQMKIKVRVGVKKSMVSVFTDTT